MKNHKFSLKWFWVAIGAILVIATVSYGIFHRQNSPKSQFIRRFKVGDRIEFSYSIRGKSVINKGTIKALERKTFIVGVTIYEYQRVENCRKMAPGNAQNGVETGEMRSKSIDDND